MGCSVGKDGREGGNGENYLQVVQLWVDCLCRESVPRPVYLPCQDATPREDRRLNRAPGEHIAEPMLVSVSVRVPVYSLIYSLRSRASGAPEYIIGIYSICYNLGI